MRMTLVSVLAFLLQWGMPANAQPQAGAQPTVPAETNRYLAHPPAKPLFFFTSDHENMGRAVFGRPSEPRNIALPVVFRPAARGRLTEGFLGPYSIAIPVYQQPTQPTLRFPPTGLLPLESLPPQDVRKFLRPNNTRLFFFSKP